MIVHSAAHSQLSRRLRRLAVHGHTLLNMDAPNISDLITPREVARSLSVAEETLASWRSRKKPHLPFLKVGRLVRYRRSDLVAFVERAAP
jgi:excisionase family DNA binding protein